MSILKKRSKNTSSHDELKKVYMSCLPTMFQTPGKYIGNSTLRSRSIPVGSPRPVRSKDFNSQTSRSIKVQSLEEWNTVHGYSKNTNVFIILGEYPDLKQSLKERGWVENPDPDSPFFNLLWARSAKVPIKIKDDQTINHFPKNFELSCKWNFCDNIRKTKKLFDINPNSFFPRCYRMIGKDYDEFCDVFKIYKAISILKTFAFFKSGYCYEKIITSMNVARRWMNFVEKEAKADYERSSSSVYSYEWKIICSSNAQEASNEFYKHNGAKNLIPLEVLPQATEDFLEKLTNFDPQVSICGSKNVWIVKPGGKSRGRDIMVFSNLDDIKSYTQNSQQWVVQKYIENPLLIQNKKFDIREWVLVSNSNPLTIWVYLSSYLRFSVENYDISNLSNKYSHLTNNSISKHSKKFKTIGNGCMWHITQFIDYLRERRHKDYWRESIFPKIKEIITYSISSAGNLGRKNCIELFGYDFMIDNTLTPWLIEINSSPAMDYSTVISI